MRFNMLKRQVSGAALVLACNLGKAITPAVALAALATSGQARAEEATYAFDIPAASAEQSLKAFTDQSGVRVFADYDAAIHTQTNAIKGRHTAEQALRLMLEGTQLEIADVNSDRIAVRVKVAESGKGGGASPQSGKDGTAPAEKSVEVVVTGTRIRGANPTSPVHVITREDIDDSGYSQVGDLVRSLPENFSGGQNPGVLTGATVAGLGNQNATNASTVNLRGLGTDATLVLLNGHRLAADSQFQGSDISGIPLAAIRRIEIVPDGASALYGSDAVAGVVNFVLRRDFNGTEISAENGFSSQGGAGEQTYGVLTGLSGATGHVLLNYEYAKSDPLYPDERGVTAAAVSTNTLLRPQHRNSLFLSAGYDFGEVAKLSLDALVSDRDSDNVAQLTQAAIPSKRTTYTPGYEVSPSIEFMLPNDWSLNVVASAAGGRDSAWTTTPTTATQAYYTNRTDYIEATASGDLLRTPAGAVKSAFGGGFRSEGFDQNFPKSMTYINKSRDVSYLYGEALVPLVAPSLSRPGLESFELDVSGRFENYSDFGNSFSPKLGFRYRPLNELTLRGSWGKSFKAPSFQQMYLITSAGITPAVYYGGPATGSVLVLQGGNPNLKPEKSKSWTLGFDWTPPAIPSSKLSATLFTIDYTDRVVQPVSSLATALSNSIYAPFVEASPSTATLNEVLSTSGPVSNPFNLDPSKDSYIVFDNYQNATAQTARGVDVAYRQSVELPGSQLQASLNATWLTLKQRTISTVPAVTLSGTIYNPPKFKARGGLTWTKGNLSATGTVNFISAETDTGVTPNRTIASWTTADAAVSYRFGRSLRMGQDVRLSLSASNLFDRTPPRAVSPSTSLRGINFDSTNASVLGRYVRLSLAVAL